MTLGLDGTAYRRSMTALLDALRAGDKSAVRRLLVESPELATESTDDSISANLWALYVGEPALAEELARAAGVLDGCEAAALGETATLSSLLDQDPTAATAWTPDGFTPLHASARVRD